MATRGLIYVLVMLFVAIQSCSSSQLPAASTSTQFVPFHHVAGVPGGEQEHDAVFYPDGERDFYPDRDSPRRVVLHHSSGGTLDLICMNDDCSQLVVRTKGLSGVNDGSLELIQIDSRICLVRDGVTEKQLGYLAEDEKGDLIPAKSLDEARAAARAGQSGTSKTLKAVGNGAVTTLKVTGEVVLGALIVTAVVAGALAEGAAQAQQNRQYTAPLYAPSSPAFTNCNRSGDSMNCVTY